ncbi:MAG TPA: dihydrodipicolinate synthase family protein [Casimicrobiaceae bacterium]|nr:dihydrodipicolinate synthase family protein [Casimicrobiaceae bacterium]
MGALILTGVRRATGSGHAQWHNAGMSSTLTGVFPVLATPFHADLSPDAAGLAAIARYAIHAGADGVVFPGVASEYETLTSRERAHLVEVVADAARSRVPFVVGGSAPDLTTTVAVVRQAREVGAAAVMIMAPKALSVAADVAAFFAEVARTADVPIMLQNAPPPAGSGLAVDVVLDVMRAVPQIAYVKEEALPSGARISRLIAGAPATLRGVLGGAGGRYITDELARGALGTMPAVELTELHAALFGAHRMGDRAAVRRWFDRMLPVLNMQAVFRMSLTKEVLRRRGIIECAAKRAPGPSFDAGDHAELTELLAELADVLVPPVIRGAP